MQALQLVVDLLEALADFSRSPCRPATCAEPKVISWQLIVVNRATITPMNSLKWDIERVDREIEFRSDRLELELKFLSKQMERESESLSNKVERKSESLSKQMEREYGYLSEQMARKFELLAGCLQRDFESLCQVVREGAADSRD